MAGRTNAANPRTTSMYSRYQTYPISVIRAGRSISQYRHAGMALILLLLAVIPVFGQAGLAGPIKHQFLTSAGAICSKCLLYSWAAGTSTPLSTYTTGALSVANDNPIVLDSAGRVTGSSGIFLTAAAYKFELRTAAGASIWIQDGVYDVGYLAQLATAAVIQTITSTGTQNNFVLTDNVTVLRLNNPALVTFTGFAAGDDGQIVNLVSIGAGQVDINDQSVVSSAANRVLNGVTGTISLSGSIGRARMVYDANPGRWRILQHEQGAWITPTFNAGDYTAATGNWTVDSGDVSAVKYWLTGRTMIVQFTLGTTDVSATPTFLRREIPGGFTSAAGAPFTHTRISDAGGASTSGIVLPTAATLQFYSSVGGGGWSTTAADNTSVQGSVTIEVQ